MPGGVEFTSQSLFSHPFSAVHKEELVAQVLTIPQPARFSRSYITIWGLAELGKSLVAGTFGALLPIFYQDYLGLEARWIAIASVVYAVWNAINDPLFGYITDSTRSKRGRRIPYLRFTAPFLGLTFILVWLVPGNTGQSGLFWWMLVAMLLFDTCYTIIGLVYSALLPEVTESDRERHKLQVSASLLGLVGTLLGFMIPDFFRPKAGGAAGADVSFLPLQASMVVVAIVCVALLLLFASRVKERPEFTRVDKPLPIAPAVRYTFTSRPFLALVTANFMAILMNALLLGAMFYLADYVLRTNALVPLAAVFIPLLIGVPVTQIVARRLGVVATQQVFLLLAGAGLILLTFAPPALIVPCLALAGFGLAGPQTITNLLFRAGSRSRRAAFRRAAGGRFLWDQCPDHQARAVPGARTAAVHPAAWGLRHARIERRPDLPRPAARRTVWHPRADRADSRRGDDRGRDLADVVSFARAHAAENAGGRARAARG